MTTGTERKFSNLQEAGEQIRQEYNQLQARVTQGVQKPFELGEMIHHTQLEGVKFRRNPLAEEAEQITLEWAQLHGIYSPKYAEGSLTMGAFLHPEGPGILVKDDEESALLDRLVLILKTYALLFYFDDWMGNDRLKFVSETPDGEGAIEEQTETHVETERLEVLKGLGQLFSLPIDQLDSNFSATHPAVIAAHELLRDLSHQSDPRWFATFHQSLTKHLAAALASQNNERYTYDEFKTVRNDVAGMLVTVDFLEFASGQYIEWNTLPAHLKTSLEKIARAVAWIGSLSNDLFSFEKEVVDSEDGFNIVPVLLLNNLVPDLTTAIVYSLALTRQEIQQFAAECEIARQELEAVFSALDLEQATAIAAYIRQAEAAVHAAWAWQLATDRYTHPERKSIFYETDKETRLQANVYGKLKLAQPYK